MKRATTVLSLLFLAASTALPATDGQPSLQTMIDASEPGAVLHVDEYRYEGPIVITHPITLIGRNQPHIAGNGEGNVVHVIAPDVRIEGFRITGSGANLSDDNAGVFVEGDNAVILGNLIEDALHGIYVKRAKGARIERNIILGKETKIVPIQDVMQASFAPEGAEFCSVKLNVNQRGNGIHLWNSSGHRVIENEIRNTRDGIYFSFSHHSWVHRNHIENVRYGLHYMYSDFNHFQENTFADNAAGAALMYSEGLEVRNNHFISNQGHRAYGLLVQSVDDTTFRDNDIQNNTVGLYIENSNNNGLLENSVRRNYVGIRLSSSSQQNVLSRNRFVGNLHPVEFDQDSTENQWSKSGRGNYWQGAQTVDLTGDGIGDLPHRETDLLGKFRRPFPLAALLSRSPALELLRLVQQRLKIPGVPAIEDPAPLNGQYTEKR